MLFRITYKDPESETLKTVEVRFYDSPRLSASDWAHDYAYALADKGWYRVVKLYRETVNDN